ncbi:EamA family transporter [Microbacterium sp. RD1]|uniref:EamA family transporter n=1 Tax=Microbacterium sp. RD1 TaxID=3457313 RepID=UPI003FA58E29
MIAVLLALGSAVLFGAGDFAGGLAARRTPATTVILWSQALGVLLLAVGLLVIPGVFRADSLLWGAAAGLAGGVALLLFYRSLAEGSMSVAAPLTALGSAGVPVLIGVVLGERTTFLAVVGIVIALVAAVLVSAEGGRLPAWRELLGSRTTGGALAAGALFGLFFVLLAQSSSDSGLWPLAGARAASIGLMLVVAILARRALVPARAAIGTVIVAGAADMGANILFLLATRQGLLIITAVLVALYPAVTVLLAQVGLRERASGLQIVGFVAAAAAVTCIALG